MLDKAEYDILVKTLHSHFGERLKTIVLFGSRSRAESHVDSDHDIFIVVENLPQDPLARQRVITAPLLPVLVDLPEGVALIAKTPQELQGALSSLLIDVCIDGISLYGDACFSNLRSKVMQALQSSGLERRRLADTWMWILPSIPAKDWSVTWEGYHEHV